MVLFFAKGEADSDKFVKFCYGHYRDIMSRYGADLPKDVRSEEHTSELQSQR